MPYFRMTWFYRLANRGWSETYYREFPSIVAANVPTQATLNAALAMRARSVVLESLSIVQEGSVRLSRVFTLGITAPSGSQEDPRPDVPSTSAFVRLRTLTGASRGLWLRGLNDSDVRLTPNLASEPANGLRDKIDNWIAHLSRAPFTRMRLVEPVAGSQDQWVTGVTVDNDNPAWARLTLQGGVGQIVAGSLIRITRVPQQVFPGLRGIFRVVNTGPGLVVIAYRIPGGGVGAVTFGTPRVRLVHYVYDEIDNGEFVRFSSRDTGRPTGTPRGRGRAVIRRQ